MRPEARSAFQALRDCVWPALAFAIAAGLFGLGTPASAQDHLKRLLIVYPG